MKRSLYREYRPQTFEQLVGQQHVARTLRNAVQTGSVAHAYVFAGPRGTGKTSAARILAKALNCLGTEEQPVKGPTSTPCGVCHSCLTIATATSLDVIEMDAASNRSIDDIRELRDRVAFAPVEGRFKVYIVDEVHMLTREAFNALLKTLEEPPANVVFVLATTEPHKIPETIISRCQRFDFRRPHLPEIARLLRGIVEDENARSDDERGGPSVDIQDAALLEIARHSQGGFRDAIGTLEKLIAFSEGSIAPGAVLDLLGVTDADLLFELTDIVIERHTAESLQFVQRLADAGTDYSQYIRDLLRHLRQLFLLQHLEEAAEDVHTLRALSQTVELDEQALDRLLPQAHQLHAREIVHAIELLGQAQREIRDGLDARLQFELALVRMTRPQIDHSPAGLEERLRRLEAAVAASGGGARAGGGPAATPSAPPPGTGAASAAAAKSARAAAAPGEKGSAPAVTAPEAAEKAPPGAAATPGPPAPAAPAPEELASEELASETGPAPGTTDDAADPSSAPSIDRVRRAWELIRQRVQETSVQLYALLRDARPSALEDDVLVVALPSEFALARVKEAGNADRLAAVIEEVLGWRLTPRFTLAAAAAEADASTPSATAAPQELDFTAMIRMAEETFDAEKLPDDQ